MNVKYLALILFTLSACGLNPGTLTINDSPPSGGKLIYQGGFTSSASVSGGAKVYDVNGLIVLFLENYVAPTSSQLVVFLQTSRNDDFFHVVTKSSLGSQTYSTGLINPGVNEPFTQVTVRLNTSKSSTLFATAYLSAVLP